jgi:ubiquinone/menaquinone biosynthesis C-methylase UbiE
LEHNVEWTDDRVKRIWDYYSRNPAYESQYFSKHSGAEILSSVSKWINPDAANVLDFGSGPGHLLKHLLLQHPTGRVHALEFSNDSVQALQSSFNEHSNIGRIVHADTLPSTFEDESMDAVYCIEVIEHLTDIHLTATFSEIRRILSKTGRAVFTTPNAELLDSNSTICPECGCIFHRWQHVRSWTANSLRQAIAHSGLKVVTVQETDFRFKKKGLASLLRRVRHALGLSALSLPHLYAIVEK